MKKAKTTTTSEKIVQTTRSNPKAKEKFVVLERGRDFTLTALANHLNSVHGGKGSGKPFQTIDVQKYVWRGHLPEAYGGMTLTSHHDDVVGIKMIRVGEKPEVKKSGKSK